METETVAGVINGEATRPKHAQLRSLLTRAIREGRYRVGDRMESEVAIGEKYNVSIITVRRALQDMQREGLISRRRGAGTFIERREPKHVRSFTENCTVLVSGYAPQALHGPHNTNWFIGYELHRGILDGFHGRVRLIRTQDAAKTLEQEPSRYAVIYVNPKPESLEWLRHKHVSWVVVDQEARCLSPVPNTVGQDRFIGVYEGMSYLIRDLGHRSIALMTSSERSQHGHRFAAYMSSLRVYEIPFREDLVVSARTPGSIDDGEAAMEELIGRGKSFSAVFVDTDAKAIGAIRALRRHNLRVPEDVSILSFDDAPGADEGDPPLTTVRVPYHEMGLAAVKLLGERVETGGDVPGKLMRTHLVKRSSCAEAKR